MASKSEKVSQNWATPQYLYDYLDSIHNFDFDPCPKNAKEDGLQIEWGRSNFVNPPYDYNTRISFLQRARLETLKGNKSVLLLPASTSSGDWHDIIMPYANEVLFIKGRLSFREFNHLGLPVGKLLPAMFDSMLVVFDGKEERDSYSFLKVSSLDIVR